MFEAGRVYGQDGLRVLGTFWVVLLQSMHPEKVKPLFCTGCFGFVSFLTQLSRSEKGGRQGSGRCAFPHTETRPHHPHAHSKLPTTTTRECCSCTAPPLVQANMSAHTRNRTLLPSPCLLRHHILFSIIRSCTCASVQVSSRVCCFVWLWLVDFVWLVSWECVCFRNLFGIAVFETLCCFEKWSKRRFAYQIRFKKSHNCSSCPHFYVSKVTKLGAERGTSFGACARAEHQPPERLDPHEVEFRSVVLRGFMMHQRKYSWQESVENRW